MATKNLLPCNSASPSFNGGCEVAANQMKANSKVRAKIRDPRGKFSAAPRGR